MSSQQANSVSDPGQRLVALNAELLNSGRYSDLTIKCRGKVFMVHRNIVAIQSKPLAAAIDGEFMEAKTGVIDLEDGHPDTIEKFIWFLYTQQYDDGQSQTGSQALHTNTALYITGEKFDVVTLKALAKEKYESAVSTAWNCASFVSSLKLLYAETPETDRLLKDVAVKAAPGHLKELVELEDFAELCKNNGEIAFDILRAWASPISTGKAAEVYCCRCLSSEYVITHDLSGPPARYHCNRCNRSFN